MSIKPSIIFIVSSLFTIFLSLTSLAQTPVNNYEKEWKQVDAFVKKELPKSALEQVKKIYQLAKKEKQDAQVIKALVYRVGLQNGIKENSEAKEIADIEKEIVTINEPAKSILNSLLAEMYRGYYQQHRWQLYERTNTQNFKKEDIATWTADDLHKKIGELFLLSI